MQLPTLLSKKSPEQVEELVYVEIGLDWVASALWTIDQDQVEIVARGTFEVGDTSQKKSLVELVDLSISSAIEASQQDPSQILFCLPQVWTEDGQVTPDKKNLIQHVCQKLDFKPLGFVVTTEAIVHSLEQKNGQPVTAFILELSQADLYLSLSTNSQIIESHLVGRSQDLAADIREGVARFTTKKPLPSYMVLYGNDDLDGLKQELLQFDWKESLSLFHIPKVDTLTVNQVTDAAVNAGSSQLMAARNEPKPSKSESQAQTQSDDGEANFGFQVTQVDEAEELSTNLDDPELAASLANVVEPDENDDDDETDVKESNNQYEPATPTSKSSSGKLSALLGWLPPVKWLWTVVGVLIAVAIASLTYWWVTWYLPSADVEIVVEPKRTQQNLDFAIATEIGQSNLEEGILKATELVSEETAQVSTEATGEKLVGERARADIIIYNRTDSPKSFPAGTILRANGQAYTLDQDVEVASASSTENDDLSVTTQPAAAEGSITATDIGAEYNQDGLVEFSLENYATSSYLARAEAGISGGTSREITAVAEADHQLLLDQARDQIQARVSQETESQTQEAITSVVLPNYLDQAELEYSAQVGDEATQVSLTLRADVTSLTFARSDLVDYFLASKQNMVEAGVNIDSNNLSISRVEIDSVADDQVNLLTTVQLSYLPSIDLESVKQNIVGKNPDMLSPYLHSAIPGFVEMKIAVSPSWLRNYLPVLPTSPARLNLSLVSADEGTE